jgi:microcystin degradation protein MlrC
VTSDRPGASAPAATSTPAHRIGIAGLWHETNTYSARTTSRREFAEYELVAGSDIIAHHRGTRSVIGGFLDGLASAPDSTVAEEGVPLFSAGAWPGGPADRVTFAELMDALRTALIDAGPLDGLLLNLHGAMVADGEPDVESALLRMIRQECGDITVAAVLDLHGNPSPTLADLADIVIGYNTYPHVDMWECGFEAVGLLRRSLAGPSLSTAIAKVPQLTCPLVQGTDDEPMRGLLAFARHEATQVGAARISVFAGFAYSDVARAGMSVVVVDSGQRRDVAEGLADRVAERIRAVAAAGWFNVDRPRPAEAVQQALAAADTPVVLADVADNIGGGSAGDGTVLLAELLAAGAVGAVVVIADEQAVALAEAVGVGAILEATVGGRTDDLHGPPVAVKGIVTRLADGHYVSRGSWGSGLRFSMGPSAVVDLSGVTLVLTSRATPPFHSEHLTTLGIDPGAARILVAKGALAWKAAYGSVARTVIEVDTPGACPIDPLMLPRTNQPVGWSADDRRVHARTGA